MDGLDHSLSFKDLIVRTAELAGVGDLSSSLGTVGLPTDGHDLDKVKRCINEAQRMIAVENPKLTRLRKQRVELVLSPDATSPLCVNGSDTRYWLPTGFTGETFGPWRWSLTGTRWSGRADDATFQAVQANLDASPTYRGTPLMVGLEPFTPAAGQRSAVNRWVLIVYPRPFQAFTLKNHARFFPEPLVELDDRSLLGQAFDDALVRKAVACFHAGSEKEAGSEAAARAAIAAAVRYDATRGARYLADHTDPDAKDERDVDGDDITRAQRLGSSFIDGALVS